ncbi:MAG: sugar porter family MFS transporter [Chloroflexi bacterium]|nr:MAG: sugar porter family MFS transporter [Chloroflexota bacterium]TMD38981.1 MAG: sugar porter family MFS transporter [Chloroflexota bacterium]
MIPGSDSHNPSDNPAIAPPPGTRNASIYLVAGIAALGGLLVGYNTGVIAGAVLFIQKDFHLNPTQEEIAVSAGLMGAIIGALCVGPMNEALGRKRMLKILAVIFIAGSLATAVAPTYGFFLSCRIIVGFGFGATGSVVPVYLSEVAPANLRGRIVTFNQIAINFGIALSYWVNLAFAATGKGWRPMFAVAVIPSAILFLGMFITPESPAWLASHGRWDAARHALQRLGRKPVEIEQELNSIRRAGELKEKRAWRELLRPGLRLALVVAVGLAFFQQFIGINAVIYYAPIIFQNAGVSSANTAILATSLVGVVNVIFTVVASLIVDKFGRRPLLLWGAAVMTISLVALGTIFAIGPNKAGYFILLVLSLYIAAFALSFGPLFGLMSAEIFPTRVRAIGSSIATFANWVANLLVSITFLSLVNALGQSGAFWLYATMGVLAFVFCQRLVPETKGKSLEEIEHYWEEQEQRVPTPTSGSKS